jgi:hypothetical protein
MDDVVRVTRHVLRDLRPYLPAIVVFGAVYFALSRLGLTRSIIWSLAAPTVFAMIAEHLVNERR